jgi:hypothetical protein
MKKYVIAKDGKRYATKEVLNWPQWRLTKLFNPDYENLRQRYRDKMREVWADPEFRQKRITLSRQMWQDPDKRKSIILQQKIGREVAKQDKDAYALVIKKMSESALKRYAENKEAILAKRKKTIAEKKKDPSYMANVIAKRKATWAKSKAFGESRAEKIRKTVAEKKKDPSYMAKIVAKRMATKKKPKAD